MIIDDHAQKPGGGGADRGADDQAEDHQGQAAGYGWTVISRPYPTAANNATAQAAHLHEVVVDVSWQDGNVGRTFELSSLRPERKPRPGETIR